MTELWCRPDPDPRPQIGHCSPSGSLCLGQTAQAVKPSPRLGSQLNLEPPIVWPGPRRSVNNFPRFSSEWAGKS